MTGRRQEKRRRDKATAKLPLNMISAMQYTDAPVDLHYVLVGRVPTPAPLWRWSLECERPAQRRRAFRVRFTRVQAARVSTVFLAMAMGWPGQRPQYFETAIITRVDGHDQYDIPARYSTWHEAVAGHRAIVRKLRKEGYDVPVQTGL